jgi:hypothetical protein
LSVTVAKFFTAAGIKNIFSGVERVASEIGFDHLSLNPFYRDDFYEATIHGIESMKFFPCGMNP